MPTLLDSVQYHPSNIQFIPKKNQTREIYRECLYSDVTSFIVIKDEMCTDVKLISYLNHKKFQTKTDAVYIFEMTSSFKYIDVKYHTKEFIELIISYELSWSVIPRKLQTYDIYKIWISNYHMKDYDYCFPVKFRTYDNVVECININYKVYRSICHGSCRFANDKSIQLLVLSKNTSILEYIRKPTFEVVLYVLQNSKLKYGDLCLRSTLKLTKDQIEYLSLL